MTDMAIEFHDDGPDQWDRRSFTLFWKVDPYWDGLPSSRVLVTERAQVYRSDLWRKFLSQGAVVRKENTR